MYGTRTRSASRHPLMTYGLIGTCSLLFLLGPASGFLPTYGTGQALYREQAEYFRHWGVLPRELWSGAARPLLTPLTAVFLHGSWPHLLGNMLFLFVFGELVEERMGRLRFLCFYLAAGYATMLCYAGAHPGSAETLVGASGAIAGILGAFLYLFPKARVTSIFPFVWFLPLRFPAWMVLLFWLVLQGLAARGAGDGPGGGPGVAYLAHIAGFALGFLYAWTGCGGATPSRVESPAEATKDRSLPGDDPRSPDEGISP